MFILVVSLPLEMKQMSMRILLYGEQKLDLFLEVEMEIQDMRQLVL